MPKTCIVIPFFNEQNRIDSDAFINFVKQQNDFSLMLVNDGSSDETITILNTIKEQSSEQINVYSLSSNMGKAEAIRQGTHAAWRWKDFDFFGYMDADLATPLEEAPRLISYFSDYRIQFVIGSRIKLFGWDIQRSLRRHYLGRIFATYVSNLFDLEIYDTQCGAKFYTNCLAQDLYKEKFVSKWFFDIELILRLQKRMGRHFTQSLIEIPLHHWNEKGDSKLVLSDYLKTPLELQRIKRKYR
jgi:glycosyltransferase involved in cell wall biosynthesis